MAGEPVVIVGNPEHDRLGRALFYRSGKIAHFLSSLPPMIWVISQRARHRWGWVSSHDCNGSQAGKPWERAFGSVIGEGRQARNLKRALSRVSASLALAGDPLR